MATELILYTLPCFCTQQSDLFWQFEIRRLMECVWCKMEQSAMYV